jgi:hypothetical protein
MFVRGKALADLADKIAQRYPGHRVEIMIIDAPLIARLADPLIRPFAFAGKQAALEANLDLFRPLDVLVVPEKTSLSLKRHQKLAHLKFVYTHHGAGDRADAYYPQLANFDLVLAPGRKIADRLISSGLVKAENCAIVGYPKFSVRQSLGVAPPSFAQKRITVLYNPHYSRRESSWAPWGRDILDFFRRSDRYNLIFAPHILLYQRWLRHRARPLGRWRGQPHMHLDTGSDAMIDMTYLDAADLYLGDVSSQIYEFLLRPRPAVFLDPRAIAAWQRDESFVMWQAGDVVTHLADLPNALDQAHDRHARYAAAQRGLFDETFDRGDQPDEERAAQAIVAHFTKKSP